MQPVSAELSPLGDSNNPPPASITRFSCSSIRRWWSWWSWIKRWITTYAAEEFLSRAKLWVKLFEKSMWVSATLWCRMYTREVMNRALVLLRYQNLCWSAKSESWLVDTNNKTCQKNFLSSSLWLSFTPRNRRQFAHPMNGLQFKFQLTAWVEAISTQQRRNLKPDLELGKPHHVRSSFRPHYGCRLARSPCPPSS